MRCLHGMPGKQALALIAMSSNPRAEDKLPLSASWKQVLSLEATQERRRRGEVCYIGKSPRAPLSDRGTIVLLSGRVQPQQQAQACSSTGTGGLGLPSVGATKMSAAIGNMVVIVLKVLGDVTGPLENRTRSGLPASSIITQLGTRLKMMVGPSFSKESNRLEFLVSMTSTPRILTSWLELRGSHNLRS